LYLNQVSCINTEVLILKKKKISLKKKINLKPFKKYYLDVKISPSHKYLCLPSANGVTITKLNGTKIDEIKKAKNFVTAYWNKTNFTILLNNAIETYLITEKEVAKESTINISPIYSSNNLVEGKIIISVDSNSFSVIPASESNNEIKFEQKYIDYDKKHKLLYSKGNASSITVNQIDKSYKLINSFTLYSQEITNFSPLQFSYYPVKNTISYVSPNKEFITNPTYSADVSNTGLYTAKRKYIGSAGGKYKRDTLIVDTLTSVLVKYSNSASFFDATKQKSKKMETDIESVTMLLYENRKDLIENILLRKKFEDSLSAKIYTKTLEKNRIRDVRITNSGKMILRNKISEKEGKIMQILDAVNEQEVGTIAYARASFSPNNEIIAIQKTDEKISLFLTETAEQLYGTSLSLQNVYLTNDTSFFIGKKFPNDYYIISRNEEKLLKAAHIMLSKDGKKIIAIAKNQKTFQVLSLPNLEVLKTDSLSDNYKKFWKSGFYFPNPDCSKFAVFRKGKLVIYKDSKFIELENIKVHNPVNWIDKNRLVISRLSGPEIYNTATEKYEFNTNLKFYFPDYEVTSIKSDSYEGNLSQSAKFATLQLQRDGRNFMYFKNTSQKEKHYIIPNAEFLAFSEDECKIFFKKGESVIAYAETAEVLKNLPADSLKITIFKTPLRSTRLLPPTPDMLAYDGEAPADYHYERITNYKHISEAKDSLIGLYAQNVVSDGRQVNVNLHLIDKAGNYYYGASESEFRDIWCETWLKYEDGTTVQLEDYTVKEVTKKNTPNYALGLVLDHSGSMGSLRCFTLQKGSELFINSKRNQDKVSVLKFDHETGVEVGLNDDPEELLKHLKIVGDDGYGGSTALYDGIYAAISEVSKASSKTERAVIVMTDGYENSSFTYLNELILYAVEKDVKIYTIGFGAWVNTAVLQTIAYQTGGGAYQIYKSSDFKWIFEDVFNKMTNYYTVSFKTPDTGKHAVLINICHELIENSAIIAFDNTKLNYSKIREKGDDGFGVSLVNLSDTLSVKEFKKNKQITDIEKIISSDGSNIDYYTKREFEDIKFPDIKFLTDKTVIVKGTDKGLDKVIQFLKKHPSIIIKISGHTDTDGETINNLALSKRRAKKVKQTIVKHGINANRILTAGYGEAQPIATNKTEKGRLKNRRVEFKIVK